MTIDKAIKVLEDYKAKDASPAWDYQLKALRLGIEALKRVNSNRLYPHRVMIEVLPGETKEW